MDWMDKSGVMSAMEGLALQAMTRGKRVANFSKSERVAACMAAVEALSPGDTPPLAFIDSVADLDAALAAAQPGGTVIILGSDRTDFREAVAALGKQTRQVMDSLGVMEV